MEDHRQNSAGCSSQSQHLTTTSKIGVKVNDSVYRLYPEGTEAGVPTIEIAFFHGVTHVEQAQSYLTTWMTPDGSLCWPKVWLPELHRGAAIYLISYDSSAITDSTHGRSDLYIVGETVLTNLRLAKIGQNARSPLVLVGHDLGGLVIKQICSHADRLKEEIFLKQLKGVFFLATPHGGLPLNAKPSSETSKIYKGMEVLHDETSRLNEDFRRLKDQHMWKTYGVQASHGPKPGQLNWSSEAAMRLGGGQLLMIDTGGDDITRPEDQNSGCFPSLRAFIETVLSESTANAEWTLPSSPYLPIRTSARIGQRPSQVEEFVLRYEESGIAQFAASSSTDDHLKSFAEQLTDCDYSLAEIVGEYETFCRMENYVRKKKVVLSSVLQILGNFPVKQIRFDNISGEYLEGLLPQEWDSFFTSLLTNPILHTISIDCSDALCSTVCTHISAFLASSGSLTTLEVGSSDRRGIMSIIPLTETAMQALSEGLVQTRCLKTLRVFRKEREWTNVLTRAFLGGSQNESLELLELTPVMEELEEALPVLLSKGYQALKEIRLVLNSDCRNWWDCFGYNRWDTREPYLCSDLGNTLTKDKGFSLGSCLRTLQQTTTCTVTKRRVVLVMMLCDAGKVTYGEWIDKIVVGSEGDPVLEIELDFTPQQFTSQEHDADYDPRKRWLINALKRYTQLTQVNFVCRAETLRIEHLLPILEAIKSNESLKSLGFSGSRNDSKSEPCWTYLFGECLRHKTNLKKLSFRGCRNLGDESFISLMHLLQVNICLEQIDLEDTPWEDNGKAILVREALRRNKAQAAYFSTLGNAKLRFHDAKAGRLFLCGNPLAGKTRLRMTMINTQSKRSWVEKQLEKQLLKIPFLVPLLKRTKGIDVEMLKDDDEMQVSIWDLAGQEIFRALQDLVLPRINQACVFVFVFSPVKDNQLEIKDEVDMAFRDELKSWLRFVASNCQITGSCLPQVLVVITHKDWMEKHSESCQWAMEIVNHYRKMFENVLDLHGGEKLHYIDAQNVEEVQPLTDHILHLFADFLNEKTPSVPWVCSQLISEIAKHPKEMINRPVWPMDDFYIFISQRLEALKAGSFKSDVEAERKVLEAVTLYMHDVGSVFASKSGLVVVDINWLTHKFLGKLISDGHSFQVKEGIPYKSSDGFVGKPVLDRILFKFCKEYEQKGVKVDAKLLEQLLVDLGLCYLASSENGVARYFIPTIFCRKGTTKGVASQTPVSWNTGESSYWRHFGYRLQCEKPDTSLLTPSVFPRFQIRLLNESKLTSPEFRDKNLVCGRDLIRIRSNGCFIIVENDSVTGDHIDILVRYSSSKPREEAIAFVKENILTKFREFCVLREGCPGVPLVVAIIRPECVKRLTPHEYREHQVVLVESLKTSLREEVVEKLHPHEISWQSDGEGDHLLNYQHMWPDVPEADLLELPEPAIVLLEKTDLEKILKAVQELQAQSLQELDVVAEELDDILEHWSDQDFARTRNEWGNGRPLDGGSIALCNQATRMFNATTLPIHGDSDGIQDHLMEMKASFALRLEGIRGELTEIFRLRKDVRFTLLSIMSKLDDLIGYSDALKKARIPRRPFFTVEDVGFSDRMSGVSRCGPSTVRLHLRCESRLEPHVVEGQPGLRLYIADEIKEPLLCISVNAMQVVWYLIKAGVQVMSDTKQSIPEFSELSPLSYGSLVSSDMALEAFEYCNSMVVEERRRMTEEAWIFLNKCLLSDFDFRATFKLHLVEYFPGTVAVNESYAWLCKNCITEGKKNGVLREV